MAIKLDTEMRVVRYSMAMRCVCELLEGHKEGEVVGPHRFSMLLRILNEEHERIHPMRNKPTFNVVPIHEE